MSGLSQSGEATSDATRKRDRHRDRCCECRRKGPSEGGRSRTWRHLDLAGIKCVMRYRTGRVKCRRCGIKTDMCPGPSRARGLPCSSYTAAALMLARWSSTRVTLGESRRAWLPRLGEPIPLESRDLGSSPGCLHRAAGTSRDETPRASPKLPQTQAPAGPTEDPHPRRSLNS